MAVSAVAVVVEVVVDGVVDGVVEGRDDVIVSRGWVASC